MLPEINVMDFREMNFLTKPFSRKIEHKIPKLKKNHKDRLLKFKDFVYLFTNQHRLCILLEWCASVLVFLRNASLLLIYWSVYSYVPYRTASMLAL